MRPPWHERATAMRNSLLRNFPARWTFWWVVIPNLLIIAMWPVGGPGMAFSIALCGLAAILLSQTGNRMARAAAIVAIILFNLLMYIAYSFNLDILSLFGSLQYAVELNPLESPEYIVAGIILLASIWFAVRHAPGVPGLHTWEQRALAMAVLVNADALATASTSGSYKAQAPQGTPVVSATVQNRLGPDRLASRHLVVIMVEALGLPGNAEDKAIFDQTWDPRQWQGRYEVSTGKALYFGSTTNAEMREFCGLWDDHRRADLASADCLPRQFARAGFSTIAMHAFEGTMFDRLSWYPRIGFQQMIFGPDMIRRDLSRCGGVFSGACDRDVPRLIGDVLRRDPDRRKLVYWLTLNSHLPVPAETSLGTDVCTLGSAQWRESYPQLCRGAALHQQLADAITQEIMRPDFPEADILIVGDHMPPYFPRKLRTRFDNAHVPWIMLRSRPAAVPGRQADAGHEKPAGWPG